MCKQIISNSFKNKIVYKLFTHKSYMYNNLTVWKEMTDFELNCLRCLEISETIQLYLKNDS